MEEEEEKEKDNFCFAATTEKIFFSIVSRLNIIH